MKLPVFKEPRNGGPSVSLTLLVISFICVLVAGTLHMFDKVSNTSLFSEVFYSAVALYFGRRIGIGGKVFSSEKAETIKKKVNDE